MLRQLNFDSQTKIQVAIQRIKDFERLAGTYYLAYSGGKDSIVIKKLAEMAEVKFQAYYNLTTVDPPEIVQTIKKDKSIQIMYPEISMIRLIEKKLMPPTRMVRYCCGYFKERGGKDRYVITGVRHAESSKRKQSSLITVFDKHDLTKEINLMNDNHTKRRYLENCQIQSKIVLNPILDWTDKDVWDFIKFYKLEYPSLYDEGFSRLGCIGCPLAVKKMRIKEFEKFPKFYNYYLKAFDLMLKERDRKKKVTKWKSAQEVIDWWLSR